MSKSDNTRRRFLSGLTAALGGLTGLAGSTSASTTAPQRFADVPPSNRYYEAIQYLGTNGPDYRDGSYVSGYPDGTFRPYQTVTRAEFAVMYDTVFDIYVDSEDYYDEYYADVEDHWAKESIYRLSAADIVSGVGGFYFNPDEPVTRGQALAMLTRYDLLFEDDHDEDEREEALDYFSDSWLILPWAKEEIGEAAARGYINPAFPNGSEGSRIKPRQKANRGIAAVYIYRKLGYPMENDLRSFPPGQGFPFPFPFPFLE
jgi:hypothetical protein